MARIPPLFPDLKTVYENGRFFAITPEGKKWGWDSLGLRLSTYAKLPKDLSLRDRIDRAQDKLAENTAHFLTIQYIWTKAFGRPEDSNMYRKILGEARAKAEEEDVDLKSTVKALLFQELAKLDTSTSFTSYIRWGYLHARTSFTQFVFNIIINFFAKRCIKTHLKLLRDFTQAQQQKDDFVSLHTQITKNIDRCLTILNGTYTAITKKAAPSGTIDEMVTQELSTPNSNQGISSDALYTKVADRLIQTTLGSVIGFLTSRLLQLFISPGQIVGSLVQTTSSSAVDTHGYAHNMNLLFLDQLKQIANLLKHPTEGRVSSQPLSEERKRSLSTIINQLMELLNKSECKTVDELTDLVKGRGFWPVIQTRHTENWGISQIMESMVVTVANLLQMLDKNKIDELTLQILEATNHSFLPSPAVSLSEMKRTENEVASTTKKILKLTIDTGIYGALTTDDPCFVSGIPRPLAIGKKLLSTVRFLPSLASPLPIALTAATLSPFYSHTVQEIAANFLKERDIKTLTLPATLFNNKTIDLSSLISKQTVDTVQKLFQEHATPAALYVGLPLLSLYSLYIGVHSRATSRVQQLFRLSIQPNTYLSGLHHLLLIPYVRGIKD